MTEFSFNKNIFGNNVQRKENMQNNILGLNNIYNNVQDNFNQYQGLINNVQPNVTKPVYDPSTNAGLPISQVAPPSYNFETATEYPEYVTAPLNNFQKLSQLFGTQYPSLAEKKAVYDILSNLTDAERTAYNIDPEGFMSKYMERFMQQPSDRRIVNIDGVQNWIMNDGTTIPVSEFDKPNARPTIEIDGQQYYSDVSPPQLVLKGDEPDYQYKEGWIIDQLAIYDDQLTNIKAQLINDPNNPNLLKEQLRIERAKRILLGEDVSSETNINEIDRVDRPDNLDPQNLVDSKNLLTSDIKAWQTEFAKSAMNMSNQIQIKNTFQPEYLQLGGKTNVWWSNWLDKNNPKAGVNRRDEIFVDEFGNTKINQQTGREMTNGEFTDFANEWYANSLQGQNMAIRAQTGAVMNINETGRILKSMPDSGFANPDDGGILSLPKRLLSGDSPFAFAIKQDDLMGDLAKVHIRTAIIQRNQLAVPDISIKHLISPDGKKISLEEWQDLPYEEQFTNGGIERYKVVYNNPEEVGEFVETPYKWSKGIYQDGSEMTLDSVWKTEKKIVKLESGQERVVWEHSGYVPDEMYSIADNILETGSFEPVHYQIAEQQGVDKATLDGLLQTGKREAIFGIVAMPLVLNGYGLTTDAVPYSGKGLQQIMLNYQFRNKSN